MQTHIAGNFDNGQIIPIHYNDQIVNLNVDGNLNLKWLNKDVVQNGSKTSLFEKNKSRQNLADLPKPQFKIADNEGKNERKLTKMPSSYVHYTGIEEESNHELVEYDLDREDFEWLRLINAKRKEQGYSAIKEYDLEKTIDFLEKESHFQYSKTSQSNNILPLIDNDAPCCICNDMEDSNANQIIFCDMCNIAVHQECYGVPYIPEGQWLCRRCQLSPSMSVRCELCPFTTGAFKQTSDGRWAHVLCAIWLSEVHFANTVFLEPVEGVNYSIKRRHKLICKICKRKMGACLQCINRCCTRSFHVTCAFYAGIKMEVKETRNKRDPEAVSVNYLAYCHQHSETEVKNAESAAAKNREFKRRMQEARKKLANEKKEIKSSVPVPVIPRTKIEEISNKLRIENISDIVSYWSMKRESRSGVPLIRRLQVYFGQQKPMVSRRSMDAISPCRPGSSTSTSRQSNFVSHSSTTNNNDPIFKIVNLRRSFERERLISEMVLKREKQKLQALECNEEIFNKIKPVPLLMKETLEKLVQKDHQKIFTQPVDEIEVPGYYEIITKPMDFQKMFVRLGNGKYKRMTDIRADFNLMMQNCIQFNRNNHFFYKYGQRIKRIGLGVIKNAEDEEAKFGQIFPMVGQFISHINLTTDSTLNASISKLTNEASSSKETNKEGLKERAPQSKQTRKRKGSIIDNGSVKRECTSSVGKKEAKEETMEQEIPLHNQKSTRLSKIALTNRKRKSTSNNVQSIESSSLEYSHHNGDIKKTPSFLNESAALKVEANKLCKKSRPKRESLLAINTRQGQVDEIWASGSGTCKNKYVDQRQRRILFRGVEKQTYANAYLTEASSTAEDSDAPFFDAGTFSSSLEEEAADDDLPAIEEELPHSNEKKAQKGGRKEYSYGSIAEIYQFHHNDIVLANHKGMQMPARVIDLRMRYEFEEMGSHFLNKAMADQPRYGQNTFVIFFDRQNTSMWLPNRSIQHLAISKMNPSQLQSNQSPHFAEAIGKAKLFCKNMDIHQY